MRVYPVELFNIVCGFLYNITLLVYIGKVCHTDGVIQLTLYGLYVLRITTLRTVSDI